MIHYYVQIDVDGSVTLFDMLTHLESYGKPRVVQYRSVGDGPLPMLKLEFKDKLMCDDFLRDYYDLAIDESVEPFIHCTLELVHSA